MSFYDHFAKRKRNKLGLYIKRLQARKLFDLVFHNLHEKSKILEIGPGDGYIAELTRQSKMEYLGIEASSAVAEKLELAGYNIRRQQVPPIPNNIGNYDVCFMNHIIEHMNNITLASQLLEETRNHLKKNGKLVIATPDYVRWKVDFYGCDYTHNLPFTRRRLRQLLENSGYKLSYENIYFGTVFGFHGILLYWIMKLFYYRVIDDLFTNFTKSDIWYRGYLTFLPNLVAIAEKKDE